MILKSLLARIFREHPAHEPAPRPRRRFQPGKRRPMPKGAHRIDPNGSLLEQARNAGGLKR